jgi:transposase InsO family protein
MDDTADTARLVLTHTWLVNGLPPSITVDRDNRWVGRWTTGDFPSAFMRYLLCLGIQVIICPPHQPNKNAFVERFHRTQEEECLQVHRPTTLADVQQVTRDFKWPYNHEHPNQALSCGNRPPYVACPSLQRGHPCRIR